MSATDKLRRLLDERGVKYQTCDSEDIKVTKWKTPKPGVYLDYAMFLEFADGGTDFTFPSSTVTPEQAIAATLGGGECEVTSHYYYDDYDLHEFELSCGHSYTMHDDMPYPFCPICGKKVKAVKR